MKIKVNFPLLLNRLWVLHLLHIVVNHGDPIGVKIYLLGYRSCPFYIDIINNVRWQ